MRWLWEVNASEDDPLPLTALARLPADRAGDDMPMRVLQAIIGRGAMIAVPDLETLPGEPGEEEHPFAGEQAYLAAARGELDSALAILQAAIEESAPFPATEDLVNASMVAGRLGREAEAEHYSRLAAEQDGQDVAAPLALAALERGRVGLAEAWLRRGATAGDVAALATLAFFALVRGDLEASNGALAQAAERGHAQSAQRLRSRARDTGIDADVQVADQQACTLISAEGRYDLAVKLYSRGDSAAGERCLRAGAAEGHVGAMRFLADVCLHTGRPDEAEEWDRRAGAEGFHPADVHESIDINHYLWQVARRVASFPAAARHRMVCGMEVMLGRARAEGWERAFVEVVCGFASDLAEVGDHRDAGHMLRYAAGVALRQSPPDTLASRLLRRVVTEVVRLGERHAAPTFTRTLRTLARHTPWEPLFSRHAALAAAEACRLDLIHNRHYVRPTRAVVRRWRRVYTEFGDAEDPLARDHAEHAMISLGCVLAPHTPRQAARTFQQLSPSTEAVAAARRAGLALLPHLRIPRPRADLARIDAQLRVRWWLLRQEIGEVLTRPVREAPSRLKNSFLSLRTALTFRRNHRRLIDRRHYQSAFNLWTSLVDGRPFILVLRNFDLDEAAESAPSNWEHDSAPGGLAQIIDTAPLGDGLADALEAHTAMYVEVANNRPTDVELTRPPKALHLPDDAWMDTVGTLAVLAAGIVVCGGYATAGLEAELRLLRSLGREDDSVVLVRSQHWHQTQSYQQETLGVLTGARFPLRHPLAPGHALLDGFPHVHEVDTLEPGPQGADPLLAPVLSRLRAAAALPRKERLSRLDRRLDRLRLRGGTTARKTPPL
jgi:hypothetical protein